jgi:4-amino-4-deoxy-L-arabinose transferase-like glycosyltransferase
MDPDDRFHRPFYWVVGGLIVAALWIRPIASSLWVDEFGTWWSIKDGVRQAIDRSWTYQGQSPLYYLLVWGTRHVTGDQEWALRLPSVAFAALSVFLLYRLVRRLVDAECARIAAVVFIAWPIVAFSAIDFRPYALETLVGITSTLALVRWLDGGEPWKGLLYVVSFAAAVYVHYFFGLIVIPHVCYAVARTRDRSTQVRLAQLLVAVIGVVALIAPLGVELAALWGRRDSIAMPNGVSVDWAVTLLIPSAVVGALIVGGGLALANGGRLAALARSRTADLLLLVAWAAGPLVVLVVASLVTPLGLQARYSLVWAPGAVALVAVAIRAATPATARRIIVLTLAVLSILAVGAVDHLGDWRGAIDAARDQADERTVVILQSGYAESLQLDWYSDPERVAYLGAPASYYPVPGRVVVLPVDVSPVTDFAREEIEGSLSGMDRVLFITTSPAQATWVGEVLHEGGWTQRQIFANTQLVYEYTLPSAA